MFGNDRNNQAAPAADDQSGMPNDRQFMNNPMPQGTDDQVMQQSVDNVLSQGAPQMDNNEASNNYIMTDPPIAPAQDGFQVPVSVNTSPPAPINIPASPVADEDLAAIKQQALQQLSPIIDHLEQSPEEKFHITMMMLQATDDQNLVRTAYEAAKAIVDEKKRAKALLDVVNEITYFTQHKDN
ncbi:hypothetical protein H0V99_00095 [Candidatus Saccharibacteria bacterium]|nr:hypothetical protein [Candidatus Saccharibacteria bacterium]